MPAVRRLPALVAPALAQATGCAADQLFRVAMPGAVDAALFAGTPAAAGAPGARFTLFLREGLGPAEEVRLFLHAFMHLLLGHLRPHDGHGHWDRLVDTAAPHRRWDREVEALLAAGAAEQAASWFLTQYLRDLPFLAEEVPFAPDLLPLRPWPHQVHVAREILHRFPARCLTGGRDGGLGLHHRPFLVVLRHLLSASSRSPASTSQVRRI